ncbi:MAG: dihydrodipicolinate synthase family protein [Phycisphaerae bacterium]|nr:dihydrodipicolinate synthase family protein [Phycisphaerae bacterium]
MYEHIEGLIVAPFTPMDANAGLAADVVEKQADFISRNGVIGVFTCGTTGEGLSLTVAERIELAERWVAAAPDGFKVIPHVGHNSLEACKTMAAHAQKIGAWGIGAMSPVFFKPSLDELVAFCGEIAAAAPDLPFYYYHIPALTGVYHPMVGFLEAAGGKIPNLAGVKFTYEDLMDYQLCRRLDGGRFDILYGRDEILLCGLALGAKGAIGSTFNYMAPLYTRLFDAFEAGDLDTARELQDKSMQVVLLLHKYGGVRCGKAIMKLTGLDCGPTRMPLPAFTGGEYESLQAELEEIGFFDFCAR